MLMQLSSSKTTMQTAMRRGRTTRGEGMLLKKPIVIIGALSLVGVLLLATYLLASDQQDGEEVAKGNGEPSREEPNITPPKDKTLRLTVPQIERIKNDEIPTGLGTDKELFRRKGGLADE
jgi:hypothetical protein